MFQNTKPCYLKHSVNVLNRAGLLKTATNQGIHGPRTP